jgi:GNAT superfamily N-acetyltransferase
MPSPPVIVEPVRSRIQRQAWLSLPWRISGNDPCWIPPLRQNQKMLAGFGKHPVWDDAECQQFLATRGGNAVGRVAAIVNHAHNRWHEDKVGFFGFFESIGDQAVAHALFEQAEPWLAERGMTSVRGPMNPTLNYELGMLVDGFDTSPYFLTTHNPPYYDRLVSGAGYGKSQDLYGYWGDVSMLETLAANKKMANADTLVRERFGVEVRGMNARNFTAEVEMFLDIYNRALTDTWGYVPMSRGEVHHFAADLKRLIVPELTRIAIIDGKPVGIMFGLLDFNPRIKAIDGRLFPLGFWKLLGNKRKIDRIRLLSTNVLPEYQNWGVGVSLARSILQPALDHGVTACEFSWVLESNRKTIEKGGARRYKTWRIYDKEL